MPPLRIGFVRITDRPQRRAKPCRKCGKVCWIAQADAEAVVAALGGTGSTYACGGYWHITSMAPGAFGRRKARCRVDPPELVRPPYYIKPLRLHRETSDWA